MIGLLKKIFSYTFGNFFSVLDANIPRTLKSFFQSRQSFMLEGLKFIFNVLLLILAYLMAFSLIILSGIIAHAKSISSFLFWFVSKLMFLLISCLKIAWNISSAAVIKIMELNRNFRAFRQLRSTITHQTHLVEGKIF